MNSLATLMARELVEVARETYSLARPAFWRASGAVAAVLLAVTGLGFLLAAAHVALTRSLGVEAAGLILGSALLASAGALYLIALWWRPVHQPVAPSKNPAAAALGTDDLAPLAAFTAAFVLARQLSRKPAA